MNATTMMVPQTDPGAGYLATRNEIDAAVQQVLASGWYILGAETQGFEREFAAWLGIGHAVGCGNGTDALALALRACGIGQGSTVATVSHGAVATVAAIEMAGATPLLLDIEADHYTMDPAELAAVLAHPPPELAPIRAVIPVHLYGQAADMAPILAACTRHGVAVIEDASQAHGATYHGRRVGTLGRIGAFSLYPTKNLAALGDAGVLATAEVLLAERLAALRQYGWRQLRVAEEPGINSRLDELQAAILRVRLRHLDARNARRNVIAAAYDVALQGSGASPPAARAGCAHVFHQYVIRVGGRDAVQARLRLAGIGTAVHYPVPVHQQPAYAGRVALGPAGCRVTDTVAPEVLSLPMFPELSDAQVDHVCQALRTL
jgi:dTDP-4-amino-4,6-dideoxygalactose transaminase